MRFSHTGYAVVGLPVASLLDGLQSSKGCVSLALSMQFRPPVDSLSDGLQSSNGCVSPALNMQLSVPWSLAYRTVYNHPKDAFLLH